MLLTLTFGVIDVRCEITKEDCDKVFSEQGGNEIVLENCKAGNDSREWDVNADGDPSIQGRMRWPTMTCTLTVIGQLSQNIINHSR